MNRIIDLRKTSTADSASAQANAGSHQSPQRSLNPHAIAFITAVKDEKQYAVCLKYLDALRIPSGYTVERIGVLGGGSMAECYQRAMEVSSARYKIYLHVDTYVVHRELLPDLLHLFATYPKLGLVGAVGSTRLPPSGLYWVDNPVHSYGRLWQNSRPGFPASVLSRPNRRLHLMRFRSFAGDYLPAAIVDGFFMATQYDIPWMRPLLGFDFGFDLYDHVHSLEFVKAGLEVGIARQDAIWCIHWGPLEETPSGQVRRREMRLREQAEALRRLYAEFVGVPSRRFYKQYRGVQTSPGDLNPADATRDRLGVVILSSGGRGVLIPALQALLPQFEVLDDIEYEVVVLESDSGSGTADAIGQTFPQAPIISVFSNGYPAASLNLGLRRLRFPRYVLIISDVMNLVPGALQHMIGYLKDHRNAAGAILSRARTLDFDDSTCALARGDVFLDVGLFDERFPHRAGRDWWLRACRRGYSFAFLPDAVARHQGGREVQPTRRWNFPELAAADLWLVRKHRGSLWATVSYWLQRLRGLWLAVQWRSDVEMLRRLERAMSEATHIYRKFREENRLPKTP